MKKKHIVLAEDEPQARSVLSLILNQKGYRVSALDDGQKTLDILLETKKKKEKIDLLVTDIQMPGLTGIELIDQLKKNNIDIPILVITGFGSKEMVIQLMRKGCEDFIEKPFEPAELIKSVDTVFEKIENQKKKKMKELEKIKKKTNQMSREIEAYKLNYQDLDRQLNSAVNAYKEIIHIDTSKSQVKMAYQFRPLSRLGGDFFDVCNTQKGCCILVADVAGHDLGASYHAILLETLFVEYCSQRKSASEFFRILNKQLISNKKNERMVTAICTDINLENNTMEVVSAGHPPVLKVNQAGEVSALVPKEYKSNTSGVLGIFEDSKFESYSYPIHSKDRFFLYTDGIIDAFHIDGSSGEKQKLTLQGFQQLIKQKEYRQLENLVDSLWEDIFKFSRYKLHDDMLILGVEIP